MAKTKKRRKRTNIDVAVSARLLAKENEVLRLEVAKVRRAAGQLLKLAEVRDEHMVSWIRRHFDPARHFDHACGMCMPGGDVVIEGFKCAPHLAGLGEPCRIES